MSPAYPRSMHICFYIRDDVDFNKFIHDLEAESARRGMTQVKANRVITVDDEDDKAVRRSSGICVDRGRLRRHYVTDGARGAR